MFNVKRNVNLDVIAVSNKFIRKFMPCANGEYVKVYLYFLSTSTGVNTDIDLDKIAETFGCTPQFLIDALMYWEKVGVIEGAYNRQGELISMTFLDAAEIEDLEVDESVLKEENNIQENDEAAMKKAFEEAEEDLGITELGRSNDISISVERAEILSHKEDVKMVVMAAEQYLGHPLTNAEIELLLYLYDECGFSADLLDYLVEYCVSKGSKSVHYIREVAFAWYEAGIDSVTKAKSTTTTYHRDYSRIRKALGISRNLGDIELEYLNKWINEYPVDTDMIVEACNRTLLNVGKPEFRYIDSILKDWIAKGFTSVDSVYKSDDTPQIKTPILRAKNEPKPNSFANFEQRQYDEETLNRMVRAKVHRQMELSEIAEEEVEEDLVKRA